MIDIINTENSDRDFGDANNDEVLESYEKKPLSIYIHIPFCVKKCAYCDFLSFPVGAACMSDMECTVRNTSKPCARS